MDTVITKVDFNATGRYRNNATCIDFSIQDNVINTIIEVSDWSILETYFPRS